MVFFIAYFDSINSFLWILNKYFLYFMSMSINYDISLEYSSNT